MCRVPKYNLAPGTQVEDPITGCRGCASGSGGEKNIFGNKYGQYLAAIQVAREDRLEQLEQDDENDDEDNYKGPVGAADGSAGRKSSVWADDDEDDFDPTVQEVSDSNLATRQYEREDDDDQTSKKARR